MTYLTVSTASFDIQETARVLAVGILRYLSGHSLHLRCTRTGIQSCGHFGMSLGDSFSSDIYSLSLKTGLCAIGMEWRRLRIKLAPRSIGWLPRSVQFNTLEGPLKVSSGLNSLETTEVLDVEIFWKSLLGPLKETMELLKSKIIVTEPVDSTYTSTGTSAFEVFRRACSTCSLLGPGC